MNHADANGLSREEKERLEALLKNFWKKNKIKLQEPVDVFKLATALKFDVRGAFFEDISLHGLMVVNETWKKIENFRSNKVIAYSKLDYLETVRFTVARFLASYILAKSKGEKRVVLGERDEAELYKVPNKSELQKDYLALAILLPREIVFNEFRFDQQCRFAIKYRVHPDLLRARCRAIFSND